MARAVLDRHRDALDRIDALLPPGEALSREIPQVAPGPLVLDEAQIAMIAEGIAAYVRPTLRTRLLRLARSLRRRR